MMEELALAVVLHVWYRLEGTTSWALRWSRQGIARSSHSSGLALKSAAEMKGNLPPRVMYSSYLSKLVLVVQPRPLPTKK